MQKVSGLPIKMSDLVTFNVDPRVDGDLPSIIRQNDSYVDLLVLDTPLH